MFCECELSPACWGRTAAPAGLDLPQEKHLEPDELVRRTGGISERQKDRKDQSERSDGKRGARDRDKVRGRESNRETRRIR